MNVSEILPATAKKKVFFGDLSFGLDHGIMESWNDGTVVFNEYLSIFNFIEQTESAFFPTVQYPKIHYSAKASLRAQYHRIPTFQLGQGP